MANDLVNYDEKWAAQAARAASVERLNAGTFLTTKGGVLAVGDQVLPGNQAAVIVLSSMFENTYYGGTYNADAPAPPICYAFGHEEPDLAPHPSMQADLNYFKLQNGTCKGCPQNEWGSAEKGRGKACQNRRRLSLIPAGYYQPKPRSRDFDLVLYDDPAAFETSDVIFHKLAVTSVMAWAKYVHQVASTLHRPPHAVLTRIYLEPDPKYQYTTNFEVIEALPNELAAIIDARQAAAEAVEPSGYKPPDMSAPAAGFQRHGLRR